MEGVEQEELGEESGNIEDNVRPLLDFESIFCCIRLLSWILVEARLTPLELPFKDVVTKGDTPRLPALTMCLVFIPG